MTAIEAGFRKLVASGPYDLQLIFLSGHGVVGAERSGFLVQPDQALNALTLLDSQHLDQMLAACEAKRTILILDCCYAEAIVGKMHFFDELQTQVARLYIASSRAHQLTWEDETVEHGIFTAHLLDLLRTGSAAGLGDTRDVLDVDSELFPVLCKQVPLYVLAHKRAEQEPVKGGLSCASVTLPVTRAARRIRERTTLGTALLRLRQIATGIAASIIILLACAYLMLYYIAPNEQGLLIARNGTRWLEPIFNLLPNTKLDTGITVADLSANPATALPLQAGYTTGVWTHLSIGRYRTWFDTVIAGLNGNAAAQYTVLAGGGYIPVTSDAVDAASPTRIAMSAWSLLSDGEPTNISVLLKALPGSDLVSAPVTPFDPNDLNFEVLDLSAEDMQSSAKAISFIAALDPLRAAVAYVGLLRATQSWLYHNTDVQKGRDAREHVRNAIADVLGVIVRARLDRGLAPLDDNTQLALDNLAEQGFGEIVNAAVGRMPLLSGADAAGQRLLDQFHGNTADPAQLAALQTIMLNLDGSERAKALVDEVLKRFVEAGNEQDSFRTRLVIVAANAKSISTSQVKRLLSEGRVSLSKAELDLIVSRRVV